MTERIRSVKVTIEVDTNKRTRTAEIEWLGEDLEAFLELVRDAILHLEDVE